MNLNLTLILDLIAFFTLMFILQRFVFKQVIAMIEQRRGAVKKSLDDIEKLKNEFYQDQQLAKKELKEAKRRALEIKEEAVAASQEYRETKKHEAIKEVMQIKEKAKEEIDQHLEKVKQNLSQQVVEIAFKIIYKVLGKEVGEEKHHELVEEELRKVYDRKTPRD